MRTPKLHQTAVPFVEYLQRYRADRGALAALRGALSEARAPKAWPYLGGFRGAIGNPCYEVVAALWANDPDVDTATGNLGDTLAGLSGEHKSFDGRFKRLLACQDSRELAAQVAPVVRAAQAKGKRVNYVQLLSDLLWWDSEFYPPRVAWAQAFWGAKEKDVDEESISPELLDAEPVAGQEGGQ